MSQTVSRDGREGIFLKDSCPGHPGNPAKSLCNVTAPGYAELKTSRPDGNTGNRGIGRVRGHSIKDLCIPCLHRKASIRWVEASVPTKRLDGRHPTTVLSPCTFISPPTN